MLLELLIAGSLTTYRPQSNVLPNIKPNLELRQEVEPVAPLEAPQLETLPEVALIPTSPKKPATTPVRASQATSGNTYQAGQCVWYVKNRIPSLPNNMGSAYNWINYLTKTSARPGVVGWRGNHVVYVEAVNGDTVTVSEMNYNYIPFSTRTITVPTSKYTYLY